MRVLYGNIIETGNKKIYQQKNRMCFCEFEEEQE